MHEMIVNEGYMEKYWWVNQSGQHRIERKRGIIAGEINVENLAKTHWGRFNVSKMKTGDLIACYRSGIGIDRLACVTKKGTIGLIPWDEDNGLPWEENSGIPGEEGSKDRRAYIAKVDYLKIKPIERKDFWDDIKDIVNYKNGPIDNNVGRVRYAYAMEFTKEGFDIVTGFAKRMNPGIIEKWVKNGCKNPE